MRLFGKKTPNDGLDTPSYGVGDSSYQAAGGTEGLQKLVNDFYDLMEVLPESQTIRSMHPEDLEESRDKLARFLSGWLNGPNTFREKYGRINIPSAHQHLPIGKDERDAWLFCMAKAIAKQPYAEEFKEYLIRQLCIPAERCRTR